MTTPHSAGGTLRSLYWRARHLLARSRTLRSTYYLLRSIREASEDGAARGQTELNREFESHEDPWNYATTPDQLTRIRREIEMINTQRPKNGFKRALEVGCAEGLFTEQLAPSCAFLLAADISAVALERAQSRLQGREHIHFIQWDLRDDPVPGLFDLIVIVHAFEYVRNPLSIRRARKKLVDSLRPHGLMLIGTMKVADIYEEAWWGRFLLRSGKRINNFFAAHPALTPVDTEEFNLGPEYVSYDILLRKDC